MEEWIRLPTHCRVLLGSLLCVYLISIFPILVTEVPPLVDYPNHLGRMKIMPEGQTSAVCPFRALREFGLEERFEVIFISDEVGWRKPGDEFFNVVLKETEYSPERCLYVGDNPEDDVIAPIFLKHNRTDSLIAMGYFSRSIRGSIGYHHNIHLVTWVCVVISSRRLKQRPIILAILFSSLSAGITWIVS